MAQLSGLEKALIVGFSTVGGILLIFLAITIVLILRYTTTIVTTKPTNIATTNSRQPV